MKYEQTQFHFSLGGWWQEEVTCREWISLITALDKPLGAVWHLYKTLWVFSGPVWTHPCQSYMVRAASSCRSLRWCMDRPGSPAFIVNVERWPSLEAWSGYLFIVRLMTWIIMSATSLSGLKYLNNHLTKCHETGAAVHGASHRLCGNGFGNPQRHNESDICGFQRRVNHIITPECLHCTAASDLPGLPVPSLLAPTNTRLFLLSALNGNRKHASQ